MRKDTEVAKRLAKDAPVQTINSVKEVTLVDILLDLQKYVYFYFLNELKMNLPIKEMEDMIGNHSTNSLNEVIKDILRQEYIELLNIHKQFIEPFIQNGLSKQAAYISQVKRISFSNALAQLSIKFQKLFNCGQGPDRLSLKSLKAEIDALIKMTDVEFNNKLDEAGIFILAKSAFIEFKNKLIVTYKHYFQRAEEHLKAAQRQHSILLTMDDFDLYRMQIAEQMLKKQQLRQQRTVIELMRFYALYPAHQQNLLLLILENIKPQPIISDVSSAQIDNSIFFHRETDMTKQIMLAEIAHELNNEGLQPPYIQAALLRSNVPRLLSQGSDVASTSKGKLISETVAQSESNNAKEKERTTIQIDESQVIAVPTPHAQQLAFTNTIKLFLNADQILQKFSDLPVDVQYENKQEKEPATERADQILQNAKSIDDYNNAFTLMAPYINRHKNFLWDSFFSKVQVILSKITFTKSHK